MLFGEIACGGGCGISRWSAGEGELGEAEVENLGVASRGHENIGGLDVAMNDAFGVSGFEGVRNVDTDFQ
jgi:hypothetical protein